MPWRHHCDFPDQWRCKNFDCGSRHSDGDGAYPTNHCTCCCTYTSLAVDFWTETTPWCQYTKQEKQKKTWFKSSILANASVRGSKTTHKSSRSIHGYIWGTVLWNCIVACRICRGWQLIKKKKNAKTTATYAKMSFQVNQKLQATAYMIEPVYP